MSTSVYVHFPWCLQKCPYCDFASGTIRREQVPHDGYADAILAELQLREASVLDQELESVFFGGGTPSLWDPAELGRVLSAIRSAFASEVRDLEVTVECNPTSLDADRARQLKGVGVNRLSIGVQSLDNAHLRFLGRLHDGPTAVRALKDALGVMDRVSGDVMFGMPGQTPAQLNEELDTLTGLGLEHLSVYALTIEPGTQFGELHRKGKLKVARDDVYADSFAAIEQTLAARGFTHYEVSNYAKQGQQSRHNQHYWRGGEYLGLGAGAVGCLHDAPGVARRYRNDPRPDHYHRHSAETEVEVSTEALDAQDLIREALMLGLRTSEGTDLVMTGARAGVDPQQGREAALRRGIEAGHLVHDGDRLRVPHERWLHLDSIVSDLF